MQSQTESWAIVIKSGDNLYYISFLMQRSFSISSLHNKYDMYLSTAAQFMDYKWIESWFWKIPWNETEIQRVVGHVLLQCCNIITTNETPTAISIPLVYNNTRVMFIEKYMNTNIIYLKMIRKFETAREVQVFRWAWIMVLIIIFVDCWTEAFSYTISSKRSILFLHFP